MSARRGDAARRWPEPKVHEHWHEADRRARDDAPHRRQDRRRSEPVPARHGEPDALAAPEGGRPAEMVQAVGGVVRTRRAVEAHPRPTPRRLRRGAAPAHEPPLRGRAHAGRARVGLRLRLRRAQGRVRAAHRTPVADHARDGHRAVRMAGRRSAGTARVVVEDTDERPVEQRGRGAQETAQGRPARAPDRHARAQPRDGLRDATGATWPLETAVPNRRKH